jgi:glucose-1-phosphate cytidylyltransferase
MKVVILAGGLGTRISEESLFRPKPMVEIGGRPLLWHIMKSYSHYGINDFIICCGYKGYMIKEYFSNYFLHMSDVTFDMKANVMTVHDEKAEPWKVTLIDTGEQTATGGRLKRALPFVAEDEQFCFTYGDGLANIDFKEQLEFHLKHGKLATITAVSPPGRYGALALDKDRVSSFLEKPSGKSLINGGFFILSPKCIDLIEGDDTSWEGEPLNSLVKNADLIAYQHNGFWQAMDTLRDKNYLENLWNDERAPWKAW